MQQQPTFEPTALEIGYVVQGYSLPTGWDWQMVHEARELFGHPSHMVPLTFFPDIEITAWGVPLPRNG